METVLFVPSLGGTAREEFQRPIQIIEDKGYKVEFIPIQWGGTTITDWKAKMRDVYSQCDPAEIILAGFSYGAVTALEVAAERNPARLWLMSLSARYPDDLLSLPQWIIDTMSKEQIKAFARLDFQSTASRIGCPTILFIGDQEARRFPQLEARVDAAFTQIRDSDLAIAKGA